MWLIMQLQFWNFQFKMPLIGAKLNINYFQYTLHHIYSLTFMSSREETIKEYLKKNRIFLVIKETKVSKKRKRFWVSIGSVFDKQNISGVLNSSKKIVEKFDEDGLSLLLIIWWYLCEYEININKEERILTKSSKFYFAFIHLLVTIGLFIIFL